jgi:tetratricopeptide (TPR) repeat protein
MTTSLDHAKSLLFNGQFDLAINAFRDSLNQQPCLDAHIGLGFALHAAKRTREACAAFESGLRDFPDQAELHFGHGIALADLGDDYRAIEELKRGLELNPQHPQATLALKLALQRHTKELLTAKNFVWVESLIEHQLRLDPKCADALAQKAEWQHQMGEYEQAKRTFRTLAESKPDHPALADLAKKHGLEKQRERGWLY